jgi:aminoglycoside phosphotransferase (APT) family kinase protein
VDDGALVDALGRIGSRYAGADLAPVRLGRPDTDALLVRCGPVVVKAHAAGTDEAALAARLRAAFGSGILLRPLDPAPLRVGDRVVSVWPHGDTVPVDPARVPWADAAALLARLHTTTVSGLPPGGAVERIAGPIANLPESQDADVVRAAWRTLPAWTRGEEPAPGPIAVVHGDWHLGQLIAPAGVGWRLADVDDLGLGAPVWDFARLAALRALEIVREPEFRGFLDAYWEAGGPALRSGPSGWTALDAVARAQVVSAAARRLVRAETGREQPDGLSGDLLRVCARLAAGVA